MARITNEMVFAKFDEFNAKLDTINAKLDKVDGRMDDMAKFFANNVGKTPVDKAPTKGKAKSKAKPKKNNDYVVIATRSDNIQKVYEAMGYHKGVEFDRTKYEATAKKLGVWSDKMHRVVGTYKAK